METNKKTILDQVCRCVACGRFLGHYKDSGTLEIISSNRQKIRIDTGHYSAECKCGVVTTFSGAVMTIKF